MKLLFLLFFSIIQILPVKIFVHTSSDQQNGETKLVTEYIVQNESSERVISWIDYCNCPQGDIIKKVKHYFFSPHGDFNLITLMTDNVSYTYYQPIIGFSFLKIIEPKESFTYIGSNLEKRIIAITESDFEDILGMDFNEFNPDLLYKKNTIIVPRYQR